MNTLVDPKWGVSPQTLLPLPAISSIFMQFLAKILQNNRFSSTSQGLAPPSVWEILDPPLE